MSISVTGVSAVSGRTVPETEGKQFTTIVGDFHASPASNASMFHATVEWNDHTFSAGTILPDGSPGSYHVQGTHTYAEEGHYITRITVTPNGGASSSATGVINAADAPLTGSGRQLNLSHTATFNGVVGSFTDGDAANRNAGVYHGMINWNDGSSPVSFLYNNGAARWDVSASHKYSHAGTFVYTVQISDAGGAKTSFTGKAIVS